jgi:hypothetical protein
MYRLEHLTQHGHVVYLHADDHDQQPGEVELPATEKSCTS